MKRSVIILFLLLATQTIKAANERWMSGLPDTIRVCRVSIPGTHDSGTAGVGILMRHYARTQTLSIDGQWDAGIRFFDLRPKLVGKELKIYHGPANCHISFKEALVILKEKLQQNPTEFSIVMTNNAGGGQAAVDMTMELIRTVFPAGMLASFKADMRVADIRGRILFIHRNAPSAGIDYPGVATRGWPGNGTSRNVGIVSKQGESAVLWAQDYFTSGNNNKETYLGNKWNQINRLISSFHDVEAGTWCINHTSGYTGTGIRTNIRHNSDSTNARLLDYLKGHQEPIGIIPMDFPGQELIDAIIRCNGLSLQ
ncbi:MAG: hypothetical protein J6V95_04565 [Bacteroidaceae bacterium]|nr:hypothetical protein [Bacteroidaceae bacterium]